MEYLGLNAKVFFVFLNKIYKYEGEILDLRDGYIYLKDKLTGENYLLPLSSCKVIIT